MFILIVVVFYICLCQSTPLESILNNVSLTKCKLLDLHNVIASRAKFRVCAVILQTTCGTIVL